MTVESISKRLNEDQHSAADNALEEPKTEAAEKESHALRMWFAVMIAVLAALWLQTRHPADDLNLIIEGDDTSEGAVVRIDGRDIGRLVKSDESGIQMVALRTHANDGNHTIEVIKQGFEPFKSTLVMHHEQYVNVSLTPARQ